MFKSGKLKLKKSSFQYNAIYYYLILLLFLEWFLQHPSLRYGGYIIISLIFFIPLSFFLSKYKTQNNFKLKVVSLCLLTILIFLGRNIDRIIYENKFYKANFKENMLFYTDKIHFRIHDQLNEFSKNFQDCNFDKDKCLNNKDYIIKRSNGKLIIIKIRN